jgi:Flp pilus assembly secretin CpaC
MKQRHPLHLVRNLAILGCLLALGCGWGLAQTPVAQRLDVYFGDTTLLPIDGPIDSYNVTPDGIIKVDKSDASPNQLSIVGLSGGSAALTVKSGDRTLLFDVAVSVAPVRLYINLNESKRLTFPNPIDDTSLSQSGIVRVVQPDTGDPATTDKILLVEALDEGKTTLTVTCKGVLYRYFISTFENRGADVLEIQNDFSAKGYRNLKIAFDKDQAVISGTVPTQEELDDAVRIARQFTQFVQVKAQLGQEIQESEYTEQESIIINNIQRIANVKGLTVQVKFPMPTVITSSTKTTSTGDYIEPETTTTPQGGTIRGTGFQPPANPNQQGAAGSGPLNPKPQQNTTETTTMSENTSIPEKIFLYGDLQDDLDEAKVIRVARTFCPFIVNFLTVRDPIQIRTQIRFMQIQENDTRDTGFDWSNGGTGPTITLGFGGTSFNFIPNPINAFKNFITSPTGIEATVNANAILRLYETLGITKILREADIFLTNGQPGWYSEGEVQSYVSSAVTTASSPPLTTLTASSVFLGVNMDISPLNLVRAGGTEPVGQKIFGIPGSVGAGSSSGYNLEQDSEPTADRVARVGVAIQKEGSTPVIDNTVKYVDENGLIGMNISTQLTLPNGGLTANTVPVPGGGSIDLPDFFVRTTRTRVNLRDGQTVAIDGLIDKEISRTINEIPFLSSIPLFNIFFKAHFDDRTNEEVVVLVTPHIVRMRDSDATRYPKPLFPEIRDMAREQGDVPIIKPVRYDAQAVDIRPETPKDMKDAQSADSSTEPPPLAPHATGGMQTLQPPADSNSATPPAVDNKPPAPDNSQQSSGAPLAPSSTLP